MSILGNGPWVGCVLVCLLATACDNEDVVAQAPCSTDADCAEGVCRDGLCVALDAGAVADASDDFCEGSGPPVTVGDVVPGRTACGGAVAERTFRYALCACEDLALSTSLTTDSFDSRDRISGEGGSVGTNGGVLANAPLAVGGSLWVGGAAGITAGTASVDVGVDLRSAGAIATDGPLDVANDAWVNGDLSAVSLGVAGTLTLPESATLDVPGTVTVGTETRAPVDVPPACACADDALLDVGALVAARASDHDDARAGLEPGSLEGYGGDRTVELSCGRFYFRGVAGEGALTLRVTGRAAVYVDGDLAPGGGLTVELTDGAEIDLFVAGVLTTTGTVRFGSVDAPSRARLYLGGSGLTELSGDSLFGGNLYAPRGDLRVSAGIEVFGSLFVRRLAASGGVTIHYDTAVLEAGDQCPGDYPDECVSCRDCRSGQACVAGACGECTDSSECCAPFICAGGRCQPEPI